MKYLALKPNQLVMNSNISSQDRLRITRRTMELLQTWGITPGDQLTVLAMPDGTRSRELRKFHDETPFPDDPKLMERVVHLLEIDAALRTTYPRNARMGERWMKQPSRHFRGRCPAERMSDGLSGIMAVRAHLDCTYAWDLTGSQDTASADSA